MISIRVARRLDLGAVTDIYNEAIRTTTATFDIEEKTLAEQASWFDAHGDQHPILVAEVDGTVVGWASLSQWSDRCAYCETAEISVYVKQEHRGRRIGRKLLEAIIEEARRRGLHSLIARVAEGSDTSLHLCKNLGFQHAGVLKEVGRKFGRLLDVHMLQKIFRQEGDGSDARVC